MKNWKEQVIAFLIAAAVFVILCAAVFGYVWLVGTSNLPDWVKFGLLNG